MKEAYANEWWDEKLGGGYGLQAKHRAALSLLGEGDFPLVDLGCGNAVFLAALERAFPTAWLRGVELSARAIAAKACVAEVKQGSITEWHFPGEAVHTASLLDVIEHFEDPEPLLAAIAPHVAQIVITCPNFNFLLARLDVLRGRIPFNNKVARGGHVYWCQYDALRAMFERLGLSIVAERHMYPRDHLPIARAIGDLRPSLLAHCFVFKLATRRP